MGSVTLVFTDIEGSTRLLHELGAEAYRDALGRHRRVVREAFTSGYEVDEEGDAFFYAFPSAAAAVAAVEQAMYGLDRGAVRIRVGIHTGEPVLDPPKYVGLDVHRAARVMAAGHGGQVLLSESTRELLTEGVVVRDLGEHRLKDLSGAQRLYQLGAGEFPPLRTLHQTNLPVAWTRLVGREREIEELLELLRREDVSVVTLTGAGGGGKTRLAMQAAADAAEDYADGVWFAGLATLTEAGLVLAAIAQTFGLRGGRAAEAIGTWSVTTCVRGGCCSCSTTSSSCSPTWREWSRILRPSSPASISSRPAASRSASAPSASTQCRRSEPPKPWPCSPSGQASSSTATSRP